MAKIDSRKSHLAVNHPIWRKKTFESCPVQHPLGHLRGIFWASDFEQILSPSCDHRLATRKGLGNDMSLVSDGSPIIGLTLQGS